MKRIVALPFLLLLLAACRAPLSELITSEAGRSGDDHRSIDYRVYLPPGYGSEPERRYPLLVWFHGGGENENGWGREGKIGEIVHQRTRRGEIEPFIVLAPSAGAFTPMWFGYEKRLVGETIPHIETRYRTNGVRVAFGHSMGGLSLLMVHLRNPMLFDAVCLASPFLFDTSAWDSPERRAWYEKKFDGAGFSSEYRKNQRKYFDNEEQLRHWDPYSLLRAHNPAPAAPLLLTCGDRDPLGLWPHTMHLREVMTECGLRPEWLPQEGVGHGTVEDTRLMDWLSAASRR